MSIFVFGIFFIFFVVFILMTMKKSKNYKEKVKDSKQNEELIKIKKMLKENNINFNESPETAIDYIIKNHSREWAIRFYMNSTGKSFSDSYDFVKNFSSNETSLNVQSHKSSLIIATTSSS